jgi:hypothetical protein
MRKYVALLGALLLLAACTYGKPNTSDKCILTAIPDVIEEYNYKMPELYMEPYVSSDVFFYLYSGEVESKIRTVDGFYGIDLDIPMQAPNCGIYRLRWVLKTHFVQTSPGCENITTIEGPHSGVCYAMICYEAVVYSSTDVNSPQVMTLQGNNYVMVFREEGDWLKVDLSVGSEGVDKVGYIRKSDIGGLKGTCDLH